MEILIYLFLFNSSQEKILIPLLNSIYTLLDHKEFLFSLFDRNFLAKLNNTLDSNIKNPTILISIIKFFSKCLIFFGKRT